MEAESEVLEAKREEEKGGVDDGIKRTINDDEPKQHLLPGETPLPTAAAKKTSTPTSLSASATSRATGRGWRPWSERPGGA